jgi:uncharacterized phage infection (PIP) family protein YhgE
MAMFPTRLEMEEKFAKVFSPEQTDSLVDVIDTIRQAELRREADTQELKRGLTELTGEVKKLTAAQERTDERLGKFQQRTDERFVELAAAQQRTDERLGKFQQRTDERFAELAAAQQRTDERLGKFQQRADERFAELATAQQHTDETVADLSRAVQTLAETVNKGLTDLRREVGSLANTFGFDLEEFVAALLPPYLEKHAGITRLTLERRYFEINGGQPEEVDLVGQGQREGQPVLVLAECRTTIGGGEMRRVAQKLDSVVAAITDSEVVKIVVAMNLHPTGEKAATETGIWAIPYSRINRERWAIS